jgi:hypothetical protein
MNLLLSEILKCIILMLCNSYADQLMHPSGKVYQWAKYQVGEVRSTFITLNSGWAARLPLWA